MITGHTADVGNPEFQMELSRSRAAAVGQWLENHLGQRPGLVITQGMGGTMPLGDNSTELGRAMNRRVELKILDN
jgi:outer membrane protein OmpA-like peptidoglycan-associated protein